ncbi:hypothetical protein GWI33_007529 [Rhynchophorus ferrugineus]|uniref:Reverse transcriptase Ty1/copia-type domain-containing protein n=1 Tax=Rhynchophorus ferrugineus TaxID=354439 RepID=A0A834MET9_RHYFE|nr:hypothetical protein GWI33_007529 [Rhynchophorus ferrugineus]
MDEEIDSLKEKSWELEDLPKGAKAIPFLYVDDGLVAATNQTDLELFLRQLKTKFRITAATAAYFLGLQIEKEDDGSIKINQEAYAKDVLKRFKFSECKAVSTPMLKSRETLQSGKEMQRISDLKCECLLENLTAEDVTPLKSVLLYVAGTINYYAITHRSNPESASLKCYSNTDFGGCLKIGRSTSEVVINQRQATVATSITEAELVAANDAVKDIVWLNRLFRRIARVQDVPVLKMDNSAATRLTQNPEFHLRTKIISTKHFFIREKFAERVLGIQHVPTEQQVADIMIKPLQRTRLQVLCGELVLL